jgi:hypothetical protein
MCLLFHKWNTCLLDPAKVNRSVHPAIAGTRKCKACGKEQILEETYDMCYGEIIYKWKDKH